MRRFAVVVFAGIVSLLWLGFLQPAVAQSQASTPVESTPAQPAPTNSEPAKRTPAKNTAAPKPASKKTATTGSTPGAGSTDTFHVLSLGSVLASARDRGRASRCRGRQLGCANHRQTQTRCGAERRPKSSTDSSVCHAAITATDITAPRYEFPNPVRPVAAALSHPSRRAGLFYDGGLATLAAFRRRAPSTS